MRIPERVPLLQQPVGYYESHVHLILGGFDEGIEFDHRLLLEGRRLLDVLLVDLRQLDRVLELIRKIYAPQLEELDRRKAILAQKNV